MCTFVELTKDIVVKRRFIFLPLTASKCIDLLGTQCSVDSHFLADLSPLLESLDAVSIRDESNPLSIIDDDSFFRAVSNFARRLKRSSYSIEVDQIYDEN